jgi:hypothetical protein
MEYTQETTIKDEYEKNIQYLINDLQYVKYKQPKTETSIVANEKDKKFYKKRIYDLTRRLLVKKTDATYDLELIPAHIINAFEIFCKTTIDYFKNLDKSDIIQEDYVGLFPNDVDNEMKEEEQLENGENNEIKIITQECIDNLFYGKINKTEPNSLEKIVKRTILFNNENEVVLPRKKKINLKDPSLKNKGIVCKKKNITS